MARRRLNRDARYRGKGGPFVTRSLAQQTRDKREKKVHSRPVWLAMMQTDSTLRGCTKKRNAAVIATARPAVPLEESGTRVHRRRKRSRLFPTCRRRLSSRNAQACAPKTW
jgi:hypothetical protein